MHPAFHPRRFARLACALLTPLALELSAPGGAAPWLLPFALVPWACVARRGGRRALAIDYATGVATQIFWVRWIGLVSPVGLAICIFVEALLFPLVGACLRRPLARWPLALALPFAWVGWEYLRGVWPLDGFPWLLLGHGGAAWSWMLALGAYGGVAIASALSAASAGAAADLVLAPRERRARGAAALVAVAWLTAFLLGSARQPPTTEPGPAVLLVQPGLPQEVKREHDVLDVFAHNLSLTREGLTSAEALLESALAVGLLGSPWVPAVPAPFAAPVVGAEEQRALAPRFGPDLVAWAETMLLWRRPATPGESGYRRGEKGALLETQDRLLDERFRAGWLAGAELAPRGASFWSGQLVVTRGPGDRFEERNSVVLFDRAFGYRPSARYDKQKLVPGGEYIPLIDVVPFSEEISSAVRGAAGYLPDLKPGLNASAIELARRGRADVWRIGAAVCLDNAYEDVFREATAIGADWHLVVSNEGWFAGSSEQDHMLGFTAWHAAECARAVLRATNTGVSALFDAEGRAVRVLRDAQGRDRDRPGWMWARIPIAKERTAYVAGGWWLAPLIAAALFVFLGARLVLAGLAWLSARTAVPSSLDDGGKSGNRAGPPT